MVVQLHVAMTLEVLLPDRVFDSITGHMLADHVVVIDGERVAAVAPAEGVEDVTRRLPGYTLLPGLIDVHTAPGRAS